MSSPLQRSDDAWLLASVDNPANEDRWSDAKAIADRLGWPRRGMANILGHYERRGLVESMRPGEAPSVWSDAPPRLWRRVEPALAREHRPDA